MCSLDFAESSAVGDAEADPEGNGKVDPGKSESQTAPQRLTQDILDHILEHGKVRPDSSLIASLVQR